MQSSYRINEESSSEARPPLKPTIIFENDFLVAVDKPTGVLSIPDREGKEASVKSMLQAKYGTIFTVHRIDRDTSGLIVFAKDEATHKYLSGVFEDRSVEKFYLGIVFGQLNVPEKRIDVAIREHSMRQGYMIVHQKGKPSVTDYKVLENLGKYSFLQFQIHTGRTHQIRVHMKNEGFPILCDPMYSDGAPLLLSTLKKKFKLSKYVEEERPLLNRLALHAWKLRIPMPDGTQLELESPLPRDLQAVVKQLRKLN